MTSPAFLGVDGGGSKTLAILVDGQGRELGRGRAGSANYHTAGLAAASASVRAAAQAAQAAAGGPPVAAAWVGLAGLDHPADHALLAPHFAGLAPVLRLTNDAELLLGDLPGSVGVGLIAGTGAIAVGRDAGDASARASGWGHLLGDEGGGYDLGRRALQAATRAADGRGPATDLLAAILRHWSLATPADLIASADDHAAPESVAQLAPLVLAAAQSGDRAARAIVQRGARELADAVLAVARQLDLPPALPLALGGGLLVYQPEYRALVLRHLRGRRALAPPALVAEPARSAAHGARALATSG